MHAFQQAGNSDGCQPIVFQPSFGHVAVDPNANASLAPAARIPAATTAATHQLADFVSSDIRSSLNVTAIAATPAARNSITGVPPPPQPARSLGPAPGRPSRALPHSSIAPPSRTAPDPQARSPQFAVPPRLGTAPPPESSVRTQLGSRADCLRHTARPSPPNRSPGRSLRSPNRADAQNPPANPRRVRWLGRRGTEY